MPLVVVGVDGRRGGWALAVVTVQASRAVRVRWRTVDGQDAAGFRAVLDLAQSHGAAAVGLDCPVGLPADRWRACDLLAKRRLGRASARVFLAPPREVLAAPTYPDARRTAVRLLGGRSVSAQTYGLRRIVLAVDDALHDDPDGAALVAEVHPELSFMAMHGRGPGDPLPSKRTAVGRSARIAALARWVSRATPDGDPAVAVREAQVPDGDDHLDALAAAWSAWRWTTGEAEELGSEVDERGLPMRIVV